MSVLFIILKYTIAKENQRMKVNQSEVIDAEDLKLLEQNKVNMENPHLRFVFSYFIKSSLIKVDRCSDFQLFL